MEKNGIFIIHHDFKSDKIDAFTIRSRRYGAPIIFVNETFPEDRRRLNVAHELAHLILHYNQYYINEKRDIEKEAFEFASEFLVPTADFKSHIGSQKIELRRLANMKLYWKISMMALIKKAEFCKKITYNQSRYLYSQMADFRKVEPVQIPNFETPKLLSSLVKFINTEMGVSNEDVAAPLGINPNELKRLTRNTVFHLVPVETDSNALGG